MLNNLKEGEQRVLLICIQFGSCEVRRLTQALLAAGQVSHARSDTATTATSSKLGAGLKKNVGRISGRQTVKKSLVTCKNY